MGGVGARERGGSKSQGDGPDRSSNGKDCSSCGAVSRCDDDLLGRIDCRWRLDCRRLCLSHRNDVRACESLCNGGARKSDGLA